MTPPMTASGERAGDDGDDRPESVLAVDWGAAAVMRFPAMLLLARTPGCFIGGEARRGAGAGGPPGAGRPRLCPPRPRPPRPRPPRRLEGAPPMRSRGAIAVADARPPQSVAAAVVEVLLVVGATPPPPPPPAAVDEVGREAAKVVSAGRASGRGKKPNTQGKTLACEAHTRCTSRGWAWPAAAVERAAAAHAVTDRPLCSNRAMPTQCKDQRSHSPPLLTPPSEDWTREPRSSLPTPRGTLAAAASAVR